MKVKMKVIQRAPTLCGPMNYTVHRILQARILERGGKRDIRSLGLAYKMKSYCLAQGTIFNIL